MYVNNAYINKFCKQATIFGVKTADWDRVAYLAALRQSKVS